MPARKSDDFQPAGRAAQISAPEEQQEADGGHEGPDADARGVQFDVERRPADHQQQHGHAGRGQGLDQELGPAGLDQHGIVFQSVVLLELRKVLDQMVGQLILFGLRRQQLRRACRA